MALNQVLNTEPSGTVAGIRQNTEGLLLGCHIPQVAIYEYTQNENGQQIVTGVTYSTLPPEPDLGIVGKKMKCNPKGAFSYCHKVDKSREKSTTFDIDLSLIAELTIKLLIQLYFKLIAEDPRYGKLFSSSQLLDIKEGLIQWIASDSECMPVSLAMMLAPFFDATNVSYVVASSPNDSCEADSAEVDFVKLVAVLKARIDIIIKFGIYFDFGTSSTKESSGSLKQEVNISWDFCNAPSIKGCCGNK